MKYAAYFNQYLKINYIVMTTQKLNFGMKQQVNLTAGLYQSINILQMSNLELSEMLSHELSTNPFLEDNSEYEGQDNHPEESRYDNITMRNNSGEDSFDSIELAVEQQSLISHVIEQVSRNIVDQAERIVSMYLVNLLQDSGYIELDIEKAQNDLKIPEEAILSVLYKLQKMEPTGIFSRSLKECLTLQLKEKEKYDDVFKIILDNLPMLAAHDTNKLAKLCKIEKNELAQYIKDLKLLHPKPCVGFSREHITSRIADVILTIEELSGDIKLRLNDGSVSNLSVNKNYYMLAKSHAITTTDKNTISNYYYGANNVMRSINQRMTTIRVVATAIAEQQREFFFKGVMHLKPMTLSEIASICGMNESTISRATSNKYIETPTGIYEMKFFFSSSVQSKNNGAGISSTKVKEIIKSIIESEESSHIYSDDDIAAALTKFNINIARRTVAKYREGLGIDTSSMRKRIARNSMV